ncbi:unnamed protein product [Didymodactylos carnosus]|uniref:Reverse transcriptase domain-containing protein n=1 Tax=Didymodactylos carnosus TaxID=1234261 RepID=A0A814TVD4_9BILA|nr:unnamed protein product [Didymodactylos carnosus]CAF3926836.1 unnamed protein product [Didymodactylos carnosus]
MCPIDRILRFSLTGTRDGGHSSIQNPSITFHKSSSPIYIKVQVNQTPQHAISAVTIIHQQLLKKIHHKKFIYKRKIHASTSCTSVNIIGEIHLEIKIQGHQTWIIADVATNLVTDLLLGTDWITQNSVIIDSPQQRIILVNKCHQVIAYTPFVEPPDIRFPVFLIDQITFPPYSEQCIDVAVPITTKDAFPIPRIDDIFDHLAQAEYYTTIDFKSGYFQAGLDPKDRPKTAFSTRDQYLQFTVLPQGVTNGPPAFQRIVSQILGPTRWQYSLAYLDDVIIYSQTFE